MAFRGGRSVKENTQIDWSEIPDEAIDASKIRDLSNAVISVTASSASVSEASVSKALRYKIQTAKDLAEHAANGVAFKFQQQIENIEGALAVKIERAAALASNAIQPGVRAFLHSLKTSTIEFGTTTINADETISSTGSTFYTVVTSSGNVTVALPNAILCNGLMLGFYKSVAANDMILDGAASQTINGSTTKTFGSQHDAVIIISNGSNWFIISS